MEITGHMEYGSINAVTRSELAILSGLSDRQIRKEIEVYRLSWDSSKPFICSSPHGKGYWLTNNIHEIERFRREYGSYQSTQGRILGNIDMELARISGDKLIPVKAHFRRIKGVGRNGKKKNDRPQYMAE